MSFPFYAIFPTQISKKYSIVLCYPPPDPLFKTTVLGTEGAKIWGIFEQIQDLGEVYEDEWGGN